MNNLSKKAYNFLKSMSKDDKYAFGRIPSIKMIENGLENYELLNSLGRNSLLLKLKNERRFRANNVLFFEQEKPILYSSFTIFTNAKPNKCESDYINVEGPLNYIYLDKLYVRPSERRKGLALAETRTIIGYSSFLHKDIFMDIERHNYPMSNLLTKLGFEENFEWEDRFGREMIRYGFNFK